MRSHRSWLWILTVLVLGAVAVWFLVVRPRTASRATQNADVAFETVVRGPFVATVSATGSVRAERTQRLAFRASGTVTEVLVDDQSQVLAGAVLARLDDLAVRQNLAQAEASLAVAQAQLARTVAEPSAAEREMLDASLAIAAAGVETAQAGVDAARASQQRVLAGASEAEVAIAERRVEEAKNALWGAQGQRDAVCGRIGFGASQADCDQAQANVNRSEVSVSIATIQLEQAKAGPRSADIAAAQAQVRQAIGQLASARAQLQRAQAESARTLAGVSAEDIAVAQAQVKQAEVGVDIARSRLADLELRAPADGMVTDVNVLVGDTVAAGSPVITLIDAEAYHLVLSIDETEIGQISPGQGARIVLDAYPGVALTGTVESIGTVGSNAQGIVVFDVRINIDPAEITLRPFMTAAVDIEVMRTEDALLVPNRAIRRDAGGRYVETLSGGALVRTPIEVSASNAEYSIVGSGLAEGDEIVVSRPSDPLFQFSFGR